jgi:hypothetical protein
MKSTYAVIHKGKHIANQLAGYAERAAMLACHKQGLTYSKETTQAIELVSTPDIGKAISVACLATVTADCFEPCEETTLARVR